MIFITIFMKLEKINQTIQNTNIYDSFSINPDAVVAQPGRALDMNKYEYS